jgi:phosphate-selective porin OprO/OprP
MVGRVVLRLSVGFWATSLALSAYGQTRLPPVETVQPTPSIEERMRQLEAVNGHLIQQYESLRSDNQQLGRQLDVLRNQADSDDAPRAPLPRSFDDQPEDIRGDEPEPSTDERRTIPSFGEGFKWSTRDGEYDLVFHNETQLDVRAYAQPHSDPVNQFGFYISRVRLYFNGHLTKPIEYSVSLNKGLGDINLLDAYLNFNYDKRFQFRIGRYRVPFTYDWYALSNQFLPTPERSVFAINYGYNRNFALMIHGELGENRAEYAVALANGPRNQYFDFNADKDLLAYINYRPFQDSECFKALEYLNIGGSMTYGIQDQVPLPMEFRTSLNATESEGAFEAAPTFLQLNPDVFERGPRNMWEVHTAYYYKQLTLMAAWDTGYNSYARGNDPNIKVSTYGYHAQVAYLLTGEEVTRRTFIDPLEPFDLRPGKRGRGAFEIQARYDEFVVGNEIFTGGLADPNEWTNRVKTIDTGINWYLNKFTRIYFGWQHAIFAHPVPFRPGEFQNSSDLFWTRFQIYF